MGNTAKPFIEKCNFGSFSIIGMLNSRKVTYFAVKEVYGFTVTRSK